jgi:hypothetical protein
MLCIALLLAHLENVLIWVNGHLEHKQRLTLGVVYANCNTLVRGARMFGYSCRFHALPSLPKMAPYLLLLFDIFNSVKMV